MAADLRSCMARPLRSNQDCTGRGLLDNWGPGAVRDPPGKAVGPQHRVGGQRRAHPSLPVSPRRRVRHHRAPQCRRRGVRRPTKVGATARVRPSKPVAGEFMATVTVVDRVFDAASGTFGVLLEMPNPDDALPAGHRCQVVFDPPKSD